MRRLGKQKQMILAFKVVHICFLSNGGSPLSFDPIRNIKSNTVPQGLSGPRQKMPKWKEHGNANRMNIKHFIAEIICQQRNAMFIISSQQKSCLRE